MQTLHRPTQAGAHSPRDHVDSKTTRLAASPSGAGCRPRARPA